MSRDYAPMMNEDLKDCPFCPETLLDDRLVLVHVICHHMREFAQLKADPVRHCHVIQSLPALVRSSIFHQIRVKLDNNLHIHQQQHQELSRDHAATSRDDHVINDSNDHVTLTVDNNQTTRSSRDCHVIANDFPRQLSHDAAATSKTSHVTTSPAEISDHVMMVEDQVTCTNDQNYGHVTTSESSTAILDGLSNESRDEAPMTSSNAERHVTMDQIDHVTTDEPENHVTMNETGDRVIVVDDEDDSVPLISFKLCLIKSRDGDEPAASNHTQACHVTNKEEDCHVTSSKDENDHVTPLNGTKATFARELRVELHRLQQQQSRDEASMTTGNDDHVTMIDENHVTTDGTIDYVTVSGEPFECDAMSDDDDSEQSPTSPDPDLVTTTNAGEQQNHVTTTVAEQCHVTPHYNKRTNENPTPCSNNENTVVNGHVTISTIDRVTTARADHVTASTNHVLNPSADDVKEGCEKMCHHHDDAATNTEAVGENNVDADKDNVDADQDNVDNHDQDNIDGDDDDDESISPASPTPPLEDELDQQQNQTDRGAGAQGATPTRMIPLLRHDLDPEPEPDIDVDVTCHLDDSAAEPQLEDIVVSPGSSTTRVVVEKEDIVAFESAEATKDIVVAEKNGAANSPHRPPGNNNHHNNVCPRSTQASPNQAVYEWIERQGENRQSICESDYGTNENGIGTVVPVPSTVPVSVGHCTVSVSAEPPSSAGGYKHSVSVGSTPSTLPIDQVVSFPLSNDTQDNNTATSPSTVLSTPVQTPVPSVCGSNSTPSRHQESEFDAPRSADGVNDIVTNDVTRNSRISDDDVIIRRDDVINRNGPGNNDVDDDVISNPTNSRDPTCGGGDGIVNSATNSANTSQTFMCAFDFDFLDDCLDKNVPPSSLLRNDIAESVGGNMNDSILNPDRAQQATFHQHLRTTGDSPDDVIFEHQVRRLSNPGYSTNDLAQCQLPINCTQSPQHTNNMSQPMTSGHSGVTSSIGATGHYFGQQQQQPQQQRSSVLVSGGCHLALCQQPQHQQQAQQVQAYQQQQQQHQVQQLNGYHVQQSAQVVQFVQQSQQMYVATRQQQQQHQQQQQSMLRQVVQGGPQAPPPYQGWSHVIQQQQQQQQQQHLQPQNFYPSYRLRRSPSDYVNPPPPAQQPGPLLTNQNIPSASTPLTTNQNHAGRHHQQQQQLHQIGGTPLPPTNRLLFMAANQIQQHYPNLVHQPIGGGGVSIVQQHQVSPRLPNFGQSGAAALPFDTPTAPRAKRPRLAHHTTNGAGTGSTNGTTRSELLFGGSCLKHDVTFIPCFSCLTVCFTPEEAFKHDSLHSMPRFLCPFVNQGACHSPPSRFSDVQKMDDHMIVKHMISFSDTSFAFSCVLCSSLLTCYKDYRSHVTKEYNELRMSLFKECSQTDLSIKCKQCKTTVYGTRQWYQHRLICHKQQYALAPADQDKLRFMPPEISYHASQRTGCLHNRTYCNIYPACAFNSATGRNTTNGGYGGPVCSFAHPRCPYDSSCVIDDCLLDHPQKQKGCHYCYHATTTSSSNSTQQQQSQGQPQQTQGQAQSQQQPIPQAELQRLTLSQQGQPAPQQTQDHAQIQGQAHSAAQQQSQAQAQSQQEPVLLSI